MKAKVEILNDSIIKYNTAKFSTGLEWVTEFLSINHNREVRVYSWYKEESQENLLIPKAYEITPKHLKIEKLIEKEVDIGVSELIPSIKEFIQLGQNKKINFYDFISSPVQSVLRGLITNARFLGVRVIFQALKHLFTLYTNKPKKSGTYLIHKDLKKDQNMMATNNGVYFIDFGSSILTKYFFLTDIVELATDHKTYTVDFDIIENLIKELGAVNYNSKFLKSQIYLLLLRRYLHFHPIDRANKIKMTNAKKFLINLDSLVSTFREK